MEIPVKPFGYNEDYEQDLNQTLRNGLSDDGWTVPEITDAELNSIYTEMPNGTIWYVTDAAPDPVYVGKINGALRKFTTTAYP